MKKIPCQVVGIAGIYALLVTFNLTYALCHPYALALEEKEMSKHLLIMLLISGLLVLPAFATEEKLQAGMVNPGYEEKPPWFKDSFLDIREDVAETAASGKRLILYFYQDGCPYCTKLLKDNFGNREIAQKTQQHFEVIAINMWGDREVT